jgi:FkbM family methyltransferase
MSELPNKNFRDVMNNLILDLKYRYMPFRSYYRYRSYNYMAHKNIEMGLLKFLCMPNRASVDVGASLGMFTYYLSRYSQAVYAFEPNPYPYRVLKHVIDKNVKLEQAAITGVSGDVELIVWRSSKGWTSNGAAIDCNLDGTVDHTIVKVPGHRLDDLDIGEIGFIKINTEGHELAVLNGSLKTIETYRPNLFVEVEHFRSKEKESEVFTLLKDLNYDGFFLVNGVLTNISKFSADEFQDRAACANLNHRYIKDFIFLPR